MYESNINNNVITAKPIFLNSDQTLGENFTTENFTDNNAQDWTNHFSKSETMPNYQMTENSTYQVYENQIPSTTSNIEGTEIQTSQNYYQSTPVETTTSNFIQSTPIEIAGSNYTLGTPMETTTSNYTNNYIQSTPVETTTTTIIM